MAKKPPGCKVRRVKITKKTRSGKKVVKKTFMARSGRDCKPRTEAQRKRASRGQRRTREAFSEATRVCRRQTEPFTKQFGNCMKGTMKSIVG